MKTRILITAMMITLTTYVIAGSNHFKGEDTLYTSNLATITDLNWNEFPAGNGVFDNPTVFMPSLNSSGTSNLLEEWMENRENWEQGNSETASAIMESADLQGWIESREAWEQENTEAITAPVTESVDFEGWIASMENWEQTDSQSVTMNSISSSVQKDWITNMETWEQK
jgi:hypothetical protein